MSTSEPAAEAAVGPRLLEPMEPSPELLALREALGAELDAWAQGENLAFAATPPSVEMGSGRDHRPASVGRALNPSAHTFVLDFLAATEGERFALRVVEAPDDAQPFIEWLMQLPELKRTYGFDTVAGLVVLRRDAHAQMAWQTVLARAYDATYFVDAASGPALNALAQQIVGDLLDRGSTARLWTLWERERTETDLREYVLGKDFLAAYVADEPQADAQAAGWGQGAGLDALLAGLTPHLDALGLAYDHEVPGGVVSTLLRRYLPGFNWPLVIDDHFALYYMDVPLEPLTGEALTQWTCLARCTRYWLDKAGDLHWNAREWVPMLVLSAPIVGPPWTPLAPVELLTGAGWCLVNPAELGAPERIKELLARAMQRPVE